MTETTEVDRGPGRTDAGRAAATRDDPDEVLRQVRAELGDLAGRLLNLAENVRTVSAALPTERVGPAALRGSRAALAPPVAEAPAPSPAPAPPAPPAPPARPAPPDPSPPERLGLTPVEPAGPDRRRTRPRISIAEVFAVVGSAITLIGVTLVLVLPQDGVLGPLSRVGIAVALALAAVGGAAWQHSKDARNVGAQALMATGVASAYLCVLAVTVLFDQPDGRGLLPDAVGLALAGLISVAGLWTARRWDSQWLGVLAVLGCLVLAPFVVHPALIWGLTFMVLLTIVTAPFQVGRTWVALVAARVKPTTLVFLLAIAVGQRSLVENPTATLALAAVLAVAGLGTAVLHQHDSRPNQVAAAVAVIPMAAPAAAVCWLADRPISAAVCGVLAVLYGICGLLPGHFSPVLRAAAVPIGALFAGFGLLRLTDGAYAGSISFGLAVAYLTLAIRTRFRPVLVVGLVAAGLGTVRWLPLLVAGLHPGWAVGHGTEAVAQSLLGLAATCGAALALRTFAIGDRWRMPMTWLAGVAFGSVALILLGAEVGRLLARPTAGFQAAHALVTVAWLVLCVVLLRLGLRSDRDRPVAVRLALALAVAAVTKLFLFDLATLPGLVRALAFIAVGVLLLVIGTWYYRQLELVRGRPDAAPGATGGSPGRRPARR